MATRGRKPGIRLTEDHRDKIKNSNILTCLIEHVQGNREMSATQVTAGLGLLRKALPDLSSADNTTEVVHRFVALLPEKATTVEEWNQQYNPPSGLPAPSKPH